MRGNSSNMYIQSINKVIDYIEKNLSKKLTLEELADIGGFSKYHFHRIFSSYMNETLNGFVMRLRIEKVAMMICNNPDKTLTEIAYKCGFTDSAAFSKAFKRRFEIPANEWSKQNHLLSVNNTESNNYSLPKFNENEIKSIFVSAQIEELPNMVIAYLRYIGKYAGDGELFYRLFSELADWAYQNGIDYKGLKSICIYHDSLNLTDEEKLRVSAGLIVDCDFKPKGNIGKMNIRKAKYLVTRFKLNEAQQYQIAWDYVFGHLLSEFNVKPSSEPSFEMYDPYSCVDKLHNVSICVPIM